MPPETINKQQLSVSLLIFTLSFGLFYCLFHSAQAAKQVKIVPAGHKASYVKPAPLPIKKPDIRNANVKVYVPQTDDELFKLLEQQAEEVKITNNLLKKDGFK